MRQRTCPALKPKRIGPLAARPVIWGPATVPTAPVTWSGLTDWMTATLTRLVHSRTANHRQQVDHGLRGFSYRPAGTRRGFAARLGLQAARYGVSIVHCMRNDQLQDKPARESTLDFSGREAQFEAYVHDATFPCVGARSALNRGRMEFGLYSALGNAAAAQALCDDLAAFSARYETPGADPVSFVAMFDQTVADEAAFSSALWCHLQAMHDADAKQHAWDPAVSSDPAAGSFSFSVGGRAYFVVGLSPASSRWARRAPFPCLVFNFHEQFETLKSSGKYVGLQKIVRSRDIELQGSINPALTVFGDASEARQYAGGPTPTDWVCPFKPAGPSHRE